jgi:capsular exopolysaccharide synthesis family protein
MVKRMKSELTVVDALLESVSRRQNHEGATMSNELTIRGLLQILKRRRAMIATTVVVCFLLGVVVCIFVGPRYKAVGELEIQQSATDGLGLDNLTGPSHAEQYDALEDTITLQTQANILQSSSLALKVINDLNLESTKDFQPKFNPIGWILGLLTPRGAADPANASLADSPGRRERAIATFEKHLKVKPISGTRLIDLEYRSSDPKIASAVINDISKSLVDYALNSRYAATSQVSGWLSGQLGDIKKDAEEQQAKVEKLQRESGVYSLGVSDAQGKEIAYSATLDRLQQATEALSAATANRILKGALYKTVENGDPELISGLAGSSLAGASPAASNSFLLLQNLRTQQSAVASQFASDSSRYGSANPKLADERASLDSLNAQIQSEVARIGERISNDYHASEAVEDKMRALYNEDRKSADGLNDKAIALFIARQEATDSRSLYQTLYSHLKEAGVVQGLRSSNISIVDPGQIPAKPLPDIPIILALSLFLGLFMGVTGSIVADATSNRIEAMAAIENALGAPILAILPMTQDGPSTKSLGGVGSIFRQRLGRGDRDSGIGRVAVLDGPNTAYVEALRGLRTSLLHPRRGSPAKTILITSAAEREGKSTLSLNLAASLVLNGSRVLLVDGDMRSAGLSSYMGFERDPSGPSEDQKRGLSEALSSADEPAIITPFSELPGLSALPAGSNPRYPAELLGSDRMQALAEHWAKSYDYVLIDSPPVLAVTDAVILSRLADTTLLLTRHGESTQMSLERAYNTLHHVEGRSVGVVVNGVSRDSVSFNEFYGYKGTIYYSEA